MKPGGQVWEIYSAIQGEGLCVGERHVFLRTAGCNLRCRFCDTPARETTEGPCAIEQRPGQGDFSAEPNPLDCEQAVRSVLALVRAEPRARKVSLTGGEPLVQPEFVGAVAGALRLRGVETYLETNGTLPAALATVRDVLDWIAMDVKLPSAAGVGPLWDEHREFLKIAASRRVFVKAVITPETRSDDVARAASLVAEVDPNIPLVLQPVTPTGPVRHAVAPRLARELEAVAERILDDVRVIPQVHLVLGER